MRLQLPGAAAQHATHEAFLKLVPAIEDPLVYVSGPNFSSRTLRPCPKVGCVLSKDTEWLLDLSESQRGTVEGTIDFVTLAGEPLPQSASDGGGTLRLDLLPEAPGTVVLATPAFGGSYTTELDQRYHFRLEGLPFGTYAVSYQWLDPVAGPIGTFRFDGALVVDREQVSWRQSATVAPVVIDVTVNGEAMRDDGKLEGEPRGVLLFSDPSEGSVDGPNALRLELGETGPAHFEKQLLVGRYNASVYSYTGFGRTYLRNLEQDVLPVGQLDLGAIDVAALASGPAPTRLAFDLKVHEVDFDVRGTELLTTSAMAPQVVVSLNSDSGQPFWVHAPNEDASLRLRVYSGCYSVAALTSGFPHYPIWVGPREEVGLGNLCTCDAAPMP